MPLTVEEIHDVECTEDRGRVVALVRQMKVSGFISTTQMSASDEILSDPSIPGPGQFILIKGYVLHLTGRKVKIGSRNAKDDADVTLFYEGGATATTSETRRGGDVSIAQITAHTDREGNEMTVTHQNREKRVTLGVFSPEAAPWIETIEATNDPDALAQQWIGKVNSAPWRGKAKGKWIVARVTWDELNPGASTPLYRFRWQFQESSTSQGWLPTVAWIDNETNEMPVGLIQDEGIKSIPWYIEADYNIKFT